MVLLMIFFSVDICVQSIVQIQSNRAGARQKAPSLSAVLPPRHGAWVEFRAASGGTARETPFWVLRLGSPECGVLSGRPILGTRYPAINDIPCPPANDSAIAPVSDIL